MMDLPEDILEDILAFLSPCEVVRMRQVSKKFRKVTDSGALWMAVYTRSRARFFLPPGPFTSQSIRYFRRTLVQSELLSKIWTSRPLKPVFVAHTGWKGKLESMAIIDGRWCIYNQRKAIKCHDVDTDTHYTLYKAAGRDHPKFKFHAGTATGPHGMRVYLAVVGCEPPNSLINLIWYPIAGDIIMDPETMDGQDVLRSQRISSLSRDDVNCTSPFLVIQCDGPDIFVHDAQTCSLYKLNVPPLPDILDDETQDLPDVPADETQDQPNVPADETQDRPDDVPDDETDISSQSTSGFSIITTKTHVFAIPPRPGRGEIVIRGFMVPSTAAPGQGKRESECEELVLMHEAVIQIDRRVPHGFAPLRNSRVDPVTGSIQMRFLQISESLEDGEEEEEGERELRCHDMTMPAATPTAGVQPITVTTQHIYRGKWTKLQHGTSDDGYVRGLFLRTSEDEESEVRKFAIDASREECVVTVSEPVSGDYEVELVKFNARRGRHHLIKVNEAAIYGLTTFDLA